MKKLCNLDEISNNSAVGTVASVNGKDRNIFLVRKDDFVFCYLNWCPHNQVLIDQIPGQFMNKDNTLIQCSKHGALFRMEDGFCVEGPCEGESLKKLRCKTLEGVVYLIEDSPA